MTSFALTPSLFHFEAATQADTAQPAAPVRFLIEPAGDRMQLITTRAGFDALEADWNGLFDRAGRGEQMFQTFNWLWHWANHYLVEDADTLAIVAVRRAGHLVAILPLCIERTAGIKQLVFMGDPVGQYGDALVEDMPGQPEMLGRALGFAIKQTRPDVVRLTKVREDAALAPVLAQLKATVTSFEDAPYADLQQAGDLASYNTRFSAKCLKNRRRQGRRLEDHGTVALDWTLSGRAASDAARTAMSLKRGWMKVRGQLSRALADPRTDRFFADVCAGDQRPAGVQVLLLRSGGEIANAAITVTAKGRQAIHVLAFGLKFEKCAAGVLHVERIVENAFASTVTTLDFLAPRHDYKLEWCDGAVRVNDHALPLTLPGTAFTHVYLVVVREKLKAALKSAPHAAAKPAALAQRMLHALTARGGA